MTEENLLDNTDESSDSTKYKVHKKHWSELVQPSEPNYTSLGENKMELKIEPLEPGYGTTIGNSLRRILLGPSIYGAAITSFKIPGINHEFSSIPGVKEDVVEIVLNLKNVIVSMTDTLEKKTLSINKKGPAIITAKDIRCDSSVKILSPEAIICTLDRDQEINIEITCEVGKGYVSAYEMRSNNKDKTLDQIYIDALYNPIKSVSYNVETTRFSGNMNYDKLTMVVETNGVVPADKAIGIASKILQNQLNVFINLEEVDETGSDKKEELPFNKHLLRKISELELSVRSQNCLKNENKVYIGDLVTTSESEMLKAPNFGRKSLIEIRELLNVYGLKFGMQVPEWPPKDLAELSKKHEDSY